MVSFSKNRKDQLFHNFKNKRIIVVGDLMLDRYFWGSVIRISPEAPVPVVEIESEAIRLGGAANVAHNIVTLGAIAVPFGVVGDDNSGALLIDQLQKMNFNTEGIIFDSSRSTTIKTRIIAHNQHVVRADRETKIPITHELCDQLITKIQNKIEDCDAIVLQDYNKGLLTPEVISRIITLGISNNKIITVDPKFDNFFEYRGVSVFKPNRKETEQALGIRLPTINDMEQASRIVKGKLSCQNVLITLGEQGMLLLEPNNELTLMPTKAQKVHDVSGAGDTVISTLTVALVAGATIKEATTLANYAAGIVCSEVGVVPIYFDQLFEIIK